MAPAKYAANVKSTRKSTVLIIPQTPVIDAFFYVPFLLLQHVATAEQ